MYNTNVAIYISEDERVHGILLSRGIHHTDRQRYEFMRDQFAHKTGGQLAVRDFDVQHPLPANKNLANLRTWMLRQSPNSMASMSSDQVYPGLAQAASTSSSAIVIPSHVVPGTPIHSA
jgi:hypothetical protein